MREEQPARVADRRISQDRASAPVRATNACSCELLMELAATPNINAILREAGVAVENFGRAHEHLHAQVGGEPADWLHRISQRGARGQHISGMDQLLAIIRSADCHGYRLLELCGAHLSTLRKIVIEALRQQNLAEQVSSPLRRTSTGGRLETPPIRQSVRISQQFRDHTPASISPTLQSQPRNARPPERISVPAQRSGFETKGSVAHSSPRQTPTSTLRSTHLPLDPRSQDRPLVQNEQLPAEDIEETPVAVRKLRAISPTSLPDLHGRDEILRGLADAVSRERPRPPLLVGEQGSGRTIVAQHLARVIQRSVFWLRATSYDNDSTLKDDLSAIAQHGGVALLDDLDRVATEQAPELLPALLHAWAHGEPRLVTICNHETRARLEQWMPGVLQTLDTLSLPPLDAASIHAAVKAAAPDILAQHDIQLGPGAHPSEATRLAERYLGGLAMPGRALDLLDLAAARARREGHRVLESHLLREVVAQRTGLPLTHIHGSGERELLDLEQRLAARVVGHSDAITAIASLVRRNRAGFRSHRPIASALFLGPSGIGKTELAKALAIALFSSEDALLRLDMSEYSESHAVARAVGAPPGYVGHEQGGALTDPMIERPHRIVLLDEIEKAHRDVHQLLLQVLDEGRLTDGRGRTIDFRHALIVMTSNLGAAQIEAQSRTAQFDDQAVLQKVRGAFPVELWNRIEAPLILRPLGPSELQKILRRLVRRSSENLRRDRGITYELDESALTWVLRKAGQDPSLGARPLRHLLSRHVETLLADHILSGKANEGQHFRIRSAADTLEIIDASGTPEYPAMLGG